MGGKRPDQYQIAPSEGRTTDYKRYPEATHGRDEDLDTQGDKQRLVESQQSSRGQPFPPDIPAPSVHARHGKKLDEQGNPDAHELPDEDQPPGAADSRSGKENPLV